MTLLLQAELRSCKVCSKRCTLHIYCISHLFWIIFCRTLKSSNILPKLVLSEVSPNCLLRNALLLKHFSCRPYFQNSVHALLLCTLRQSSVTLSSIMQCVLFFFWDTVYWINSDAFHQTYSIAIIRRSILMHHQ